MCSSDLMNLKALITTFVLGSSSVAMAHPVSAPVPAPVPAPVYQPIAQPIRGPMPPQYAPGYEPTVYQPQVYQPTVYQPQVYQPTVYQPRHHRAAWTTLGGVNQIADGPMAFRVGRFGEQFSTLRLQSDAGKSLIQRVMIRFADGCTQVVEVNQYLNASNPAITIDLDGRARQIAKVTVIGRNARQSAYRVLAI